MASVLLQGSYDRVIANLSKRRLQADKILDDYTVGNLSPWQLRFYSESLLSNLWIDWNSFVKHLLFLSCSGTTSRAGNIISPRVNASNALPRIIYEVSQYAAGNHPNATKVHMGAVEPTWANPDKIVNCINGLSPSNAIQLTTAFGSGNLVGPSRIHLVRNATSHKTALMRASAQALRQWYLVSHFHEPIDIIWGSIPGTGTLAIFEWIDDLENIADLATA